MSDGRTALTEGTRVLTGRGTGVVVSIGASGWTIRDAFGGLEVIGYLDVTTVREVRVGEVAPMADACDPFGRNTSEYGRLVSKEPLMTAQELQDHLRRFVALDYHRDCRWGISPPRSSALPGHVLAEANTILGQSTLTNAGPRLSRSVFLSMHPKELAPQRHCLQLGDLR